MTTRALIIFAKLPRAGAVKTRLGSVIGMQEAAEVYRQLAEHAFSVGRRAVQAGIRVSVSYDPGSGEDEMRRWVGPVFDLIAQEGDTLGDRLYRAFERAFGEGMKRAVVVGTDVPELDYATLEHAFDALTRRDVVIGPSRDGGYYLLGMNAPAKDLFGGIPWSSETVFQETTRRLKSQGIAHAELHELADIDTIADYRAYLDRASHLKDDIGR